jgi:hypothetical protein
MEEIMRVVAGFRLSHALNRSPSMKNGTIVRKKTFSTLKKVFINDAFDLDFETV